MPSQAKRARRGHSISRQKCAKTPPPQRPAAVRLVTPIRLPQQRSLGNELVCPVCKVTQPATLTSKYSAKSTVTLESSHVYVLEGYSFESLVRNLDTQDGELLALVRLASAYYYYYAVATI